jgi:hypothetical protein
MAQMSLASLGEGHLLKHPLRVHYSIRGSGRGVQAASSPEARRFVMEMFPRATVTGVRR